MENMSIDNFGIFGMIIDNIQEGLYNYIEDDE
jgi:hypothetical protein